MSRVSCTSFTSRSLGLWCSPRTVSHILLVGFVLLGSAYSQNARLRRGQQTAAASAKPAPATPDPAPSTSTSSVPVAPPVDSAPVSEPPEQAPARPPVISWDGELLSIDTENSTLSDVLLGIRSRTGASIEMPPSASTERVAVHLGPAPVREVLSSLLYGTDFNYVIQASDQDENGLGLVILTAKSKDNAEDVSASNSGPNRKLRLMPGYAAPGKRDFEVAHQNESSAEPDNSSANVGEASNQDAAPPAAEPAPESAQAAAPAESQPAAAAATSTAAADAGASSPDFGGLTVAQQAQPASSLSSSQSGTGDGSSMTKMQQDLQRLYEQRRQMQAQQNHTQVQPPTN
jgi:hypothetical protein